MKITKAVLAAKVQYLNYITGSSYDLDYAYGGVRLVRITNKHGGVADMSERVGKPEMARILDTIINVMPKMK